MVRIDFNSSGNGRSSNFYSFKYPVILFSCVYYQIIYQGSDKPVPKKYLKQINIVFFVGLQ